MRAHLGMAVLFMVPLGCGAQVDRNPGGTQQAGSVAYSWIHGCGDPVCFEGAAEGVRACDPAAGEVEGQPCGVPDDRCDDGSGCGVKLECRISPPVTCPISSRSFKHDIAYLTESDEQRLADELRQIRLATYKYNNPADQAKSHLGFIIEDMPNSPAVRSPSMVDLYGYTSWVVAALQVQAKRTEALTKEMTKLRHQLDVERVKARACAAR